MEKEIQNIDLKFLKKHYGESFAHLCRELFPVILECEGLLSQIITNNFAPSRHLYKDVKSQKGAFKRFVFNLSGLEPPKLTLPEENKSPKELFDEAGYILYDECQTEEDIQAFKKYYRQDEELCTFRGERLNNCRVWFAVKKNVDQIKREDFKFPLRQDEYGTSVLSIQFSKEDGSLSIKNRYNHRVVCPDSTFSNNLDNINEGLTFAFAKEYNLDLNKSISELMLPGHVKGDDKKFYLWNLKQNSLYFCENNVVVNNGKVLKYDKIRYLLIDNYLIDMQENLIKTFDENNNEFELNEDDSFIKSIGEIKKINILKIENGKKKVIVTPKEGEDIEITINSRNEIIGYRNTNVKKIEDNFLFLNTKIEYLDLPNVESIGDNFLFSNLDLVSLNLPNVEKVGHYFMVDNVNLSQVNMPKLKEIKNYFLYNNNNLTSIYLPSVEKIGSYFLDFCMTLNDVDMPNLRVVKTYFISRNENISRVNFPKLKEIGMYFLYHNLALTSLNLPNVENIDFGFLYLNDILSKIEMSKLTDASFLPIKNNKNLRSLSLPQVTTIDPKCMEDKDNLEFLYIPILEDTYKEELSDKLKKLLEKSKNDVETEEYDSIEGGKYGRIEN